MTYSDDSVYEGEWTAGKRSGSGVYTYANGDKYRGEWADDLKVHMRERGCVARVCASAFSCVCACARVCSCVCVCTRACVVQALVHQRSHRRARASERFGVGVGEHLC